MLHIVKEHIRTRWTFARLLIAASGLVLLGICLFLAFGRSGHVSVIDNGLIAKNDSLVRNYTINYPVFHVEKVDVALRNYATHQVDEFLQGQEGVKNDPHRFLTLTYRIVHYGAKTTTVVFYKQESLRGRPDSNSQKIMTFDLKAQKQLVFTDIFSDTTRATLLLSRILHDYFEHESTAQLTPQEVERFAHFKLSQVYDFSLDEDGLNLYINPHQLDSPQNIQTVHIKKELLSDVLASGLIDPDPGSIPDAADPADYSLHTMPPHDEVIDPNGKLLALSFDDGPGVNTPRLLNALKKYNAHVTFFVIGRQVPANATTIAREIADGNEVGNHSWSHVDLTTQSLTGMQQQVNDTQTAIAQATGGYVPTLMRPPYGAFNSRVVGYLQSQHLSTTLWNIDTQDWLYLNAQTTYQHIMSEARDGQVMLLHDIHPTSVDAVIRAIPELQAQGYQLVTVSHLRQLR